MTAVLAVLGFALLFALFPVIGGRSARREGGCGGEGEDDRCARFEGGAGCGACPHAGGGGGDVDLGAGHRRKRVSPKRGRCGVSPGRNRRRWPEPKETRER